MRHRICNEESRNDQTTLVYSVPRKLDLVSLFVFTMCYGILFAIMIALQFSALIFALVAGFLTCVGISQAVLFGGNAPRLASCITGSVYYCALFVFDTFFFLGTPLNRMVDVSVIVPVVLFGWAVGYLSGACIAGVFLVTDRLRKWLRSVGILAMERATGEIGDEDDFGRIA